MQEHLVEITRTADKRFNVEAMFYEALQVKGFRIDINRVSALRGRAKSESNETDLQIMVGISQVREINGLHHLFRLDPLGRLVYLAGEGRVKDVELICGISDIDDSIIAEKIGEARKLYGIPPQFIEENPTMIKRALKTVYLRGIEEFKGVQGYREYVALLRAKAERISEPEIDSLDMRLMIERIASHILESKSEFI